MTAKLKPPCRIDPPPSHRRRPAWRQRLVEAERGVTFGFRADSTLFVHFFSGCVILAAAFVLKLPLIDWAVLVLAMSVVLAAELFHKSLVALAHERGRPSARETADTTPAVSKTLQIATAAVFVTMAGALVALSLIFGRRIVELFSG